LVFEHTIQDLRLITRIHIISQVVQMPRVKIDTFKYAREMNELMRRGGLLLVAQAEGIKTNAMTIGWGLLGTIWVKPVFITAVRHSRYTYKLMEASKSWTICVPAKGMEAVLEYCGTKSGRDVDKFKECKLTARRGVVVDASYIEECPIHIECTTVYKSDMKPGKLEANMEKELYKTKDFHMLYFGEVKGVYAVEDATNKLP
jgi:flavin reductase (DIM6/NTAB) family NADH-FMN oxidoreductase RutF